MEESIETGFVRHVSWRKRNAGQNQEKVQTVNEAKRSIMEAYGRKETARAGRLVPKKKKFF